MKRIWITGLMGVMGLTLLCGGAVAQAPQGGAPPMAGGQATDKDPEVDKLVAEAAKLEKAAKAKPKDEKLKLKTADAYYKAGHASMTSAKLMPRSKYRGALKSFRLALKYNPKQADAAKEKKMIEDIYTQMGRPIPND